MPDFDVQLQRTLTLNATITVTAQDEDAAHDTVQAMIGTASSARLRGMSSRRQGTRSGRRMATKWLVNTSLLARWHWFS